MSQPHCTMHYISYAKKLITSNTSPHKPCGNDSMYYADNDLFVAKRNESKKHLHAIDKFTKAVNELLHQVKSLHKIAKSFFTRLSGKVLRAPRRSSKSAKSNNSSSSSRGNDPDPEPAPYSFYHSCFTYFTTLLILISFISFVTTSSCEVTE